MNRLGLFLIVTFGLIDLVYLQETVRSPLSRSKIQDIFGTSFDTTTSTTLSSTQSVVQGQCECVSFFLCTNDSNIDTTGSYILDLRADECDNYMFKCCNPPAISKSPPIIPSANVSKECGIRNARGIGFRITGDTQNEAQFGEFPWMVAVIHELEEDGQILEVYLCGGALIHPQVVLTAAHCVIDKRKKFLVRAGEWDTQTTREIFPFQNRRVKSVTIHPEYYSGGFLNDIAFVVLESPFALAAHIDVLCLPPQGLQIPSGTRCLASGWGTNVFGKDGAYQVILKKIELPIVARNNCQENLRKTRLGASFELDPSFVCAGGEPGQDTCNGDGGSPLVCLIPGQEDRYQHVGLVSWGVGCGQNQIPGLYANVPLYRVWIDQQMQRNSFDPKVYQY